MSRIVARIPARVWAAARTGAPQEMDLETADQGAVRRVDKAAAWEADQPAEWGVEMAEDLEADPAVEMVEALEAGQVADREHCTSSHTGPSYDLAQTARMPKAIRGSVRED